MYLQFLVQTSTTQREFFAWHLQLCIFKKRVTNKWCKTNRVKINEY